MNAVIRIAKPSQQDPSPTSQSAGSVPHQAVDETHAGEIPHATPDSLEDGRYWTRLHHYLSLHSSDGFQMAKHLTQHDPAQRFAAPVQETLSAWHNRERNYENFAVVRDAALARIEVELKTIGLPYEALFDSADFAPIARVMG